MVTKLKSKTASQVFSKNLRNQGIYDIKKILHNYCIIVVKLLMLKQFIKTMLNSFEHMHYLNFLSSSSDLMQPCFQGFFAL